MVRRLPRWLFAACWLSLAVSLAACSADSSVDPSETEDVPVTRLILREGTGEDTLRANDTMTVHYVLTLENGTLIEDSYASGFPLTTRLSTNSGTIYDPVILGWVEGLQGMRVGEVRRIVVPPSKAYGSQGRNTIPPNATLTFTVELLRIFNLPREDEEEDD